MRKSQLSFILAGLLFLTACGGVTPVVTSTSTTLPAETTAISSTLTSMITPLPITTTTKPPTQTPSVAPTLTPTPWWTPSFTQTPRIYLTLTPGLQVAVDNTRPNVEKIVSAEYIKEFLILSYSITPNGGKMFCEYQPMGIENDGQTIKLYLWVLEGEYYLDNQVLETGSVSSIPVVLFVGLGDGGYRIVGFKDAGQGYQYLDINFPPAIKNLIVQQPGFFSQEIAALKPDLDKEARAYFGLQK